MDKVRSHFIGFIFSVYYVNNHSHLKLIRKKLMEEPQGITFLEIVPRKANLKD